MSRLARASAVKIGLAILAISGLLASTNADAAAPAIVMAPNQIAAYQSLPEDGRVHILIMLAKTGRADQADALLRQFPLQGPMAQNRTIFIEGLICAANHDLPAAAAKYREALASNPHLTLVRSGLAQTLAALDENESA